MGPAAQDDLDQGGVVGAMAAASRWMRSGPAGVAASGPTACAPVTVVCRPRAPPSRWQGDALALVEQLDGALGDARLELLAQQVVRHRVVMAVGVDVVVERRRALALLGLDVRAAAGSGGEHRSVELVEQLAAADAEAAHRPVVELAEQRPIAAVQLVQGEEARLRRRARIQRSTTCTPASTFALSRGRRGRAGRIAVP